MTNYDLIKVKEFIKTIDSNVNKENGLGNYNSAVLICVDAVLSINRKYYKFVVPRITYFQNKYPNIKTLNQLLNLIDGMGLDGFSNCWNYNHKERVETLYSLVKRLIEISKEYPSDSEINSLKLWANNTIPTDYKIFNVKGIGLATYQYIRMMLGASTVKPDVHIKRALSNVLNRKVSDLESITLFEQACNELKLDIATIDHNLWLLMANNTEDFSMTWKNNKWVLKA